MRQAAGIVGDGAQLHSIIEYAEFNILKQLFLTITSLSFQEMKRRKLECCEVLRRSD